MLNILNYVLVKESFLDQLKDEFEDIFKMIKDFFLMIKEVTYDVLAENIGGDIATMLVIVVCVIAVMLISLAIINR